MFLFSGFFRAEYAGELPIVISPTSGTVMAMSSLAIKVDFCTSEARVVNEVVKWVNAIIWYSYI